MFGLDPGDIRSIARVEHGVVVARFPVQEQDHSLLILG
jgi:hypothetical protein